MIFTPFTWSFGLGLAALLVQQVIKPRVPVYTLQIVRFPSVKHVHEKLLTQLTTDISFHNGNFVELNVHALLFDLYTADWEGSLHHVGVVQDCQSAELTRDPMLFRRKHHVPSTATWDIAPRANFTTVDQIYVDITSFRNLLSTATRLIASWWKGSGSLLLPTTGVAFIKANGKTPLTVSLICDNVVNTWRMSIVGLDCALHSMNMGWNMEVEDAAKQVRDHAVAKLRANETGGILTHHRHDFADLLKGLTYEEHVHMSA
ncbi:hypothetical protein MPSEU_000645800 [Mayamaea pseudoterrestris]|nr:hypothetical protein MPSEU_000645800 [Mayamaea pseudoterrestris]